MSILDPSQSPSSAELVSRQIKQQARTTFQQLVQTFNSGSRNFWRNPQATPAEIAAALGTDAVEVFQLHAKIGSLLASIKPESILPGASLVGQFSYKDDGSVEITPVVETPVVETPVVETPVVETPVVETPVVETPVVETPVVETPEESA